MDNFNATVDTIEALCTQVRRDIVRMVYNAQSGHPGGALSSTEFLVSLYSTMVRKEGFDMSGSEEDVFFLSNGHISPLFYSILARFGYFPLNELSTFRKINSRLQGHPTTHDGLPGVRMASGSLGQGLSVAVGTALAKQLDKKHHHVYCLLGDGELQEGQIWEAVMYAGAKGLNNLIVAVDYNKQQIDGAIEEVLSLGDLAKKFAAFNWEVIEVQQGNSVPKILEALDLAKTYLSQNRPIIMLLHTIMGHGVSFMMDGNAWHGKVPSSEQLAIALSENPETLKDF